MIFLAIITMIFIFYYKKYYKDTGVSPLLIFFISLFLLSLISIESVFGRLPFFASDEVKYIEIGLGIIEMPSGPDRSLWFFINHLILNYDVSFNGIALKLINIPIAACFLMLLWRIFRDKRVFLIPVIFPYFAVLAIKNLRDIPIFLFTVLTILIFHNRKPIYIVLSLIPLAMLFLLRPSAAVIVLIILLSQIFLLTIKLLKKLVIYKRLSQKILILVIIAMIVSPFAGPMIFRFNVNLYNYFSYIIFGEGYEVDIGNRVQNDPRYVSGNKLRDLCVASVRYAVTPIPTSILGRFTKGGSEWWGWVNDLILIANQIGYYVLFGYLIINARSIWSVFRQMSAMGRAVILCFLTYWPIYSVSLYGITHQRLKLPLQIAIFLIAMSVSRYKKNRRISLIKNKDHMEDA
jgi:hypothetical protein